MLLVNGIALRVSDADRRLKKWEAMGFIGHIFFSAQDCEISANVSRCPLASFIALSVGPGDPLLISGIRDLFEQLMHHFRILAG